MTDILLSDIIKQSDKIRRSMDESLVFLSDEISKIIDDENRSVRHIEAILDILLDYGYMGIGKKEFMRLNKYYLSIDEKNAKFYYRLYDDI